MDFGKSHGCTRPKFWEVEWDMYKRILSLVFAILIGVGTFGLNAFPTVLAKTSQDCEVGDTVIFGQYPKSIVGEVGEDSQPDGEEGIDYVIAKDRNDNKDYYYIIEPIEWRIIEENDDEIFLITENIIDTRAYDSRSGPIIWKDCSSREWLNTTTEAGFLGMACSGDLVTLIKDTTNQNYDNAPDYTSGGTETTDKVFLLSIPQINTLVKGTVDRIAVNTDYAARVGGSLGKGTADWWWLRSLGTGLYRSSAITHAGSLSSEASDGLNNLYGIRPALKLERKKISLEKEDDRVHVYGKYNIEYVLNGGTNHENNPYVYTVTSDVALYTPVKSGYTFKGWYSDSGYQNQVTKIDKGSTGNRTLFAKWEISQYVVTFNSNGGSTVAKKTVNQGNIVSKPTNPIKTGYTFAGWYKDESLKTVWNFSNDKVTGNNTLYAKWVINKYTATFKNGNATLKTAQVDYNKKVSSYKPKKTGYTFIGWYTSKSYNTKFDFSKAITSNKTIYSYFVKNPTVPARVKVSKVKSGQVKICWKAEKGYTYVVEQSTSQKPTTFKVIKTTTSSSYTKKGLTKKKTYYFRVRRCKIVNKVKVYSGYAPIKQAKP